MPSGQQGDVPGMPAAGAGAEIKPLTSDRLLMLLVVGGVVVCVPAFIVILKSGRKEAKQHERDAARFI
jgi:hypothetical protein